MRSLMCVFVLLVLSANAKAQVWDLQYRDSFSVLVNTKRETTLSIGEGEPQKSTSSERMVLRYMVDPSFTGTTAIRVQIERASRSQGQAEQDDSQEYESTELNALKLVRAVLVVQPNGVTKLQDAPFLRRQLANSDPFGRALLDQLVTDEALAHWLSRPFWLTSEAWNDRDPDTKTVPPVAKDQPGKNEPDSGAEDDASQDESKEGTDDAPDADSKDDAQAAQKSSWQRNLDSPCGKFGTLRTVINFDAQRTGDSATVSFSGTPRLVPLVDAEVTPALQFQNIKLDEAKLTGSGNAVFKRKLPPRTEQPLTPFTIQPSTRRPWFEDLTLTQTISGSAEVVSGKSRRPLKFSQTKTETWKLQPSYTSGDRIRRFQIPDRNN